MKGTNVGKRCAGSRLGKKYLEEHAYLFTANMGCFLQSTSKMLNWPERAALKKNVDLEDPTPLVDQVYLGCTQLR